MKMKLLVPLFVVLVMGMATSAFAQFQCAISTGTISRATSSGHTEPVGDISFTCSGTGATGTATATVQYPVMVTNSTTHPSVGTFGNPAFPIRITDPVGSFSVIGQTPTIATVVNQTGQIVITLPAQTALPPGGTIAGPHGFTLRGVLVSLAGTALTDDLKANISVSPPQGPGGNVLINSGDNTPTVITAVRPGLASAAVTGLSALFLSNGTNNVPTRSAFTMTVTENYIDMFRSAFNSSSNSATNSTQLQFTFSGMATGSTIGPCVASVGGGVTVAMIPAGGTTLAAGAAGTATLGVDFTGVTGPTSPSQTAIETVTVTCGTNAATTPPAVPSFNVAGATATPFTAPITADVRLFPTGSALGAGNAVLTGAAGAIPRYAVVVLPVGTVITFTPATTTMLIPYALVLPDGNASVAVDNSYDTGIAIANTTKDPVSFPAGSLAADQTGTITLTFFPADGTSGPFTFTSNPIGPGASYIATASSILGSLTPPVTSFQGYVFLVANFTNAHGMSFVYGGNSDRFITSASDVLVLASPAVQPRTGPFVLPGSVEYTTK